MPKSGVIRWLYDEIKLECCTTQLVVVAPHVARRLRNAGRAESRPRVETEYCTNGDRPTFQSIVMVDVAIYSGP